MWRRYRFYTKADDYRPLVFNPHYPWWCSGHGINKDYEVISSVIIIYLPETEDLKKYWDDAYEIEFTEEEKITFSDRFSRPEYFIETDS